MENRQKIIIAFILMVALTSVLILWMLVLNTGKIAVVLDPPFTVQAGDLYKQCTKNPCVLSMHAYEYPIKIEKPGYFPYEQQIQVKRWQTIKIVPKLEFMPYIEEGEKEIINNIESIITRLPLTFALEEQEFTDLDTYKNILFLNNEPFIGLKNDSIVYIKENPQKVISIEDKIFTLDFHTEENGAYIRGNDEQQLLYSLNAGKEPQLITQFTSLTEPKMAVGNNTVLVVNDQNLYKVDITKKRKELLAKQKVAGISWNNAGTVALVETEFEELPILQLYFADQDALYSLPIQTSLARATWANDDEILFITFQEKNDDLQASFAEIGLDAQEIAGEKQEVLTDHLMRLNYRNMQYKDLLEIPENVKITQIELSPDKKSLLLLTHEGYIRTIRLAE